MKITERGWPGHFVLSSLCMFRRNTLIEEGDVRMIVSTVGNLQMMGSIPIEKNIYYETCVFEAGFNDPYWDSNTNRYVELDCPTTIEADDLMDLPVDVDIMANDLHDNVVAVVCEAIKNNTLVVLTRDDRE